MTARVVLLMVLVCTAPMSTLAQVAVFAGGSAASRVGEGNFNVWTAGAQITIAPSDRGAFTVAANAILNDKDGDPNTTVTGSHILTTFRFTPFRRFWHVGTGVVILHERFRDTRRFSRSNFADEDMAFVWFTGIDLPVGRLRPFAEIRSYDFPGRDPSHRLYAFGLEVRLN
jgi:hypothetical protein